jgi:16S rRNA (cytidine1402-2'-O)-methyltransferase
MKKDKHLTAGEPASASGLPAGLYPVAIHIGNPGDVTIRALQVLRDCDAVICEEQRVCIRFLKSVGIEKPLRFLNEHSKSAEIKQLFEDLLVLKVTAVALISDAGTPGFADPGAELVQLCHDYGVPVYPVPGASSLMTALAVSGMKLDRFLYYGFLSAKREERQAELKHLKTLSRFDLIFLEAPYRLSIILEDMSSILGRKRRARLFYKLTQNGQAIFTGSLEELQKQAEDLPKGEFVLILEHELRY